MCQSQLYEFRETFGVRGSQRKDVKRIDVIELDIKK